MATHFSILAWRIPWTEEPGSLQYLNYLFKGPISQYSHILGNWGLAL